MKRLLTALAIIFELASLPATASEATYYRAWQGFRSSRLTEAQFMASLPAFMNLAQPVYGTALNNYLVAIPRLDKPSFVPDEFALLGFADEADYRRIRESRIGQAYGDAHWRIFEKDLSKSAAFDPLVVGMPLKHNAAYDLSGGAVDWSRGYNVFYLGLRKPGIPPARFMQDLADHVRLARKNLHPLGLNGYIVIANENYEAAFMNWESQEAMERAFRTQQGLRVLQDAESILETLQWSPAGVYNGRSVRPDSAYDTAMTGRQ